ncbi:RNase H domain-containing protein [Trichonephila clavipes]|nr:RNase H domain-containing protein [Trichonephila clavipes]
MPKFNKLSDHPELLKQLTLEVIDGIPPDAVKIYTDVSKGKTNTTGSGVLIELFGRVIKIERRNGDHASVFRTELIAILSERHPIHLQWVPSHKSLLGNEVADDLAKVTTSDPMDPEDQCSLRRLSSTPGLKN